MTGAVRTPLYLLLAASAVLLLAACVNLASAMLARGTARSSEFAVRSALGATRVRIVRQLLTESALLALLGCGAGLALAAGGLKLLAYFAPASLHVERVHIDMWVQGFALAVSAATALLFGLLPALRLSGNDSSLALREGSRGTAGSAENARVECPGRRGGGAGRGPAVGLGAADSLVCARDGNEAWVRPDERAIRSTSSCRCLRNYSDSIATVHAFHAHLLDRLSHINGVQAVGLANMLPLAGNYPNGAVNVEGKPFDPQGPDTSYAVYRVVGGDFFGAMGIPLLADGAFRDGDESMEAPAMIVNEEFATKEWPGEDPIGKRVKVYGMDSPTTPEPWYTSDRRRRERSRADGDRSVSRNVPISIAAPGRHTARAA